LTVLVFVAPPPSPVTVAMIWSLLGWRMTAARLLAALIGAALLGVLINHGNFGAAPTCACSSILPGEPCLCSGYSAYS
jgi:uncharacterized membrane protein YraQ (UPF0718 family)